MNIKRVMIVLAIVFASGLIARKALSYEHMLKKPPEKFCSLCHSDKQKYYDTSGHGSKSILCQACHNPHGDGNDKMLKKPAAEICGMCHSDKKHFNTSGHGKVQVACQMCHDPHGTPDKEEGGGEPEPKKPPSKKNK